MGFIEFFVIFLAIMIVSSIGFKNYVWFISLGYGLGISITGIMLLFMYHSVLDIYGVLACVIFILYGFRLSGYLAYREFFGKSYLKRMKGEIKSGKDMPIFVKCMLWVTCALLYFMMCSPIIFRIANFAVSDITFKVGMIVMVAGILLEGAADLQKNAAKKKNPKRFVDTGLYRIVRCPNYLGELIMWTGVLIAGCTAMSGVLQWAVGIIGYIGIVFVMFSGARRLEIRQDKNYGEDKEYKKYKKSVPILIPFVPLYSVKKHKWLGA
jgi:steroid 5-alpha reductase family enzyme